MTMVKTGHIVNVARHLPVYDMNIDERLERLTERHEALTQSVEIHDREIGEIRTQLRRAIRLGVKEARNERVRRQALDEKITQLAASQLLTEEKLQGLYGKMDAFIDSMRRGGNGKPR